MKNWWYGGLKKKGGASSGEEEGRVGNEGREEGLCSAAIWPVH